MRTVWSEAMHVTEIEPFRRAVSHWSQWLHDAGVYCRPAHLSIADDGTVYMHSECKRMHSEPIAVYLATDKWAQLTWYGHEHTDGPTIVTTNDALFARLKTMWLSPSTQTAVAAFNQKLHNAGIGL